MKVPLPRFAVRANKRTAVRVAPAAALATLYHHSAHFLPLSAAQTLPPITHAFAPISDTRTYHGAPVPAHPQDIVAQQTLIQLQAAKYGMVHTGPPPTIRMPDSIDLTRALNSNGQSFNVLNRLPSARESFDDIWENGEEPPLAKRVREVSDTLFGVIAGARSGLDVIQARREQVAEFLKERKADAESKVVEDAAREREEGEFAKAFGEGEDEARL